MTFGRMSVILSMLALTAAPAFSATVVYEDRDLWLSNVSSPYTAGFENATPGQSLDVSNGVTAGNMWILGFVSQTGQSLYNHNYSNSPGHWFNWGSGGILATIDNWSGRARIQIAYTANYDAVGFNLMTGNPYAGSVTVKVNGTDTYVVSTLNHPAPKFWGITATAPITTVELSTTLNSYLYVDNASYATALSQPVTDPGGEVPESSTVVLCATGLVVAGLWGRKSRTS